MSQPGPDSSIVMPASSTEVSERCYDLHTLCSAACKCTSCAGETAVCPPKDQAANGANTVWYSNSLHFNALAAIPPALIQGNNARALSHGVPPTMLSHDGTPTQGHNDEKSKQHKMKVSVIPRVWVASGGTLELKYKYAVGPANRDAPASGSKGPYFEIFVGGTKVGQQGHLLIM